MKNLLFAVLFILSMLFILVSIAQNYFVLFGCSCIGLLILSLILAKEDTEFSRQQEMKEK